MRENVLRQPMFVVLPIVAAHAVRHDVCSLILTDSVAALLAKLAMIAKNNISLCAKAEPSAVPL